MRHKLKPRKPKTSTTTVMTTTATVLSRRRPTPRPPSSSCPTSCPSAASLPSGLRHNVPPVGIQLCTTPQQQQPSSSAIEPDDYDASIMHRIVPATLHDVHVKVDASSLDICTAFDVPLHLVNTHWITTRTPHCPDIIKHIVATTSVNLENHTHQQDEKEDDVIIVAAADETTRIMESKDEKETHRHCSTNNNNTNSSSSNSRGRRHFQRRRNTSTSRIGARRMLLPAETVAYRQLADALRASLQVVREEQDEQDEIATSHYTTRQYRVQRQPPQPKHDDVKAKDVDTNNTNINAQHDTIPTDIATSTTSATTTSGSQHGHLREDDMSVSTIATTTDAIPNSLSSHDDPSSSSSTSSPIHSDSAAWRGSHAYKSMTCGYATTATHADVQLLHARRTIVKRGKGLYRAARSVSSCCPNGGEGTMRYAEVVIDDAKGEGGICVGVVHGDAALNAVVGTGCGVTTTTGRGGAGLHCAGKMVVNGKWIQSAVDGFGNAGDVVSVVVGPTTTGSGTESRRLAQQQQGEEEEEEGRRERLPLWSSTASDNDSNTEEEEEDRHMTTTRARRSGMPLSAATTGVADDGRERNEGEAAAGVGAAWTRVWFFVNGIYAGDTTVRVDIEMRETGCGYHQRSYPPSKGAMNNGKKKRTSGLFIATSLYRTGSQATLRCCARTWTYARHVQREMTWRVKKKSGRGGVTLGAMCEGDDMDMDMRMGQDTSQCSGRCGTQDDLKKTEEDSVKVAAMRDADDDDDVVGGVVGVCASVVTP